MASKFPLQSKAKVESGVPAVTNSACLSIRLSAEVDRVVPHRRDANPGTIHISHAMNRGTGRHQTGIVQFKNWGREIYLTSPLRSHKCHVARAGVEALDDFIRRLVSEQLDLNPDPIRKRASNI
jgi:hypothetical protein